MRTLCTLLKLNVAIASCVTSYALCKAVRGLTIKLCNKCQKKWICQKTMLRHIQRRAFSEMTTLHLV